jgi:hypothetical protein
MRAHIKDPRGVTISLADGGLESSSATTHIGVRVGREGRIAFLCGVYVATSKKRYLAGVRDGEQLQPSCKHCQYRSRSVC